jgi:hypothetical protein
MQDAGGNQVEDKLFPAHHQGVAGVVTPLVAHHHLSLFGQEVNDFPLAFVTPLGAHHHDVRHN